MNTGTDPAEDLNKGFGKIKIGKCEQKRKKERIDLYLGKSYLMVFEHQKSTEKFVKGALKSV